MIKFKGNVIIIEHLHKVGKETVFTSIDITNDCTARELPVIFILKITYVLKISCINIKD